MRVEGDPTPANNGLFYFVADHPQRSEGGSTSLTLNASGTKIGEMKYTPFGETRYTWGSTPTAASYPCRAQAGQREESGLGSLYDYGARFYSPVLGRFISADTIVPSPSNPQQFNRYAYGLNNPVKYTDPSGHMVINDGDGSCGKLCAPPPRDWLYSQRYGYFDTAHFPAGNQAQIIKDVMNASANGGGPVNIRQGTDYGFFFERTYMISAGVDDPLGVALGIYEDWSVAFEAWEGQFPFNLFTTSSFSVEDLPSHYLGFVAAARGFDPNDMSSFFANYASVLGPVESATQKPPQFQSIKACAIQSGCYSPVGFLINAPIKNRQFTPMIQNSSGDWVNVPWPSELMITPVGSGSNTWQFVGESHNNNFDHYLEFLVSHLDFPPGPIRAIAPPQ